VTDGHLRCGEFLLAAEQRESGVGDRPGVDLVEPVGVVKVRGLPELGDSQAADAVASGAGEERQLVRMTVVHRDQRCGVLDRKQRQDDLNEGGAASCG
jgi:hypothetical protein